MNFFSIAPAQMKTDWLFGEMGEVWECQCTACGGIFLEEKNRGKPPKGWTSCPRCGEIVQPRRWRDRAVLDKQELSFQVFRRGTGSEIWLNGYQITRDREGQFHAWEYARAVFYPGGAQRWTRARNYIQGVLPWEERKSVALKRWHGVYGQTRENWFACISCEEAKGTVMEYSQYDRALEELSDPVEYLALYCKYPACEYIWKAGLGLDVSSAGTRPGRVSEVRQSAGEDAARPAEGTWQGGRQGAALHDLFRSCGGIPPSARGWGDPGGRRRRGIRRSPVAGAGGRVREYCFDYARSAYKYFARQKKRSGLSYGNLLRDYGDYLIEIDEVGGGELLPDDLHVAHERLSARLRRKKTAQSNSDFRVRRRLLNRYRFAWHGMLIRPIDSETELIREGEMQMNCVAGYALRHKEGKTAIFVLRAQGQAAGAVVHGGVQ